MAMMENKLYIIYATNDGYLVPTLISAASALLWASNRSDLQIVVLDTGITEHKWKDFERRLREIGGNDFGLLRHRVNTDKISAFKAYKGSIGTYARLLIPQDFPSLTWCVYADGDTFFTDDPLKLRTVYDSHYAIQGQPDRENWDYDERGVSTKQIWFECNGLGWNSDQYVCAGFLLMNLNWFRANNGTERCLEFLRNYPDCQNHDQDALAYVCRGHIALIEEKWGRLSRNAFRGGRPACLHYAADAPWKLMTSRRKDYNDAHKLWFDFARKHFGYSMRELLTDPYDAKVFRKKKVVRYICKTLFPIVRVLGFVSPIGRYLRKHYASSAEYATLLK